MTRSPRALTAYDHLPPVAAVLEAWSERGAHVGRSAVRDWNPRLARALDRLEWETRDDGR